MNHRKLTGRQHSGDRAAKFTDALGSAYFQEQRNVASGCQHVRSRRLKPTRQFAVFASERGEKVRERLKREKCDRITGRIRSGIRMGLSSLRDTLSIGEPQKESQISWAMADLLRNLSPSSHFRTCVHWSVQTVFLGNHPCTQRELPFSLSWLCGGHPLALLGSDSPKCD